MGSDGEEKGDKGPIKKTDGPNERLLKVIAIDHILTDPILILIRMGLRENILDDFMRRNSIILFIILFQINLLVYRTLTLAKAKGP